MKPDGPVLRRSDYVVEPVPWAMAREMFRAYHYTGGSGNAVVFRHGLFHRDNAMDCLGAAFWMAAVPPVARSVGAEPAEVITLSRLVVVPGMPTNAASFLLGGSVKLIRADGRFRVLVTYAERGRATREASTGRPTGSTTGRRREPPVGAGSTMRGAVPTGVLGRGSGQLKRWRHSVTGGSRNPESTSSC